MYRHLKDAVLNLDDVLIRTMSGFEVEASPKACSVVFHFAFYGPSLEEFEEDSRNDHRLSTVSEYPNIEVDLSDDIPLAQQIEELSECDILGELYAVQVPPRGQGNPAASRWIVRTHAGSQAEHIQWLRSIG